jgi:hypothetical protein
MFRVLFSGDVFAKAGREVIAAKIPEYKKNRSIDLVVVNGENASNGLGINRKHVEALFDSGVDVITGGNHSFRHSDVYPILESNPQLLRPANYLKAAPGRGFCVIDTHSGPFAVINLLGMAYMDASHSPFETVERIIREELSRHVKMILVDMHAEASSEKRAMGWFLDGKVSAVVGSHTHVPTADAELLKEGTAYITDAGMTGPYDSVIGVRKDVAIDKFSKMKFQKFEPAKDDLRFSAVIIEIDSSTGRALTIEAIHEKL